MVISKTFRSGMRLAALLVCLLGLAVAGRSSSSDAGTESRHLKGKVSIDKERYILHAGREKLVLCFLPPAALDSLGFHPAAGDTLSVRGYISKYVLVVREADWKGKTFAFRDSLFQFTRPEKGTWKVRPKDCIGCNLCVSKCPGGAIEMEETPQGMKAVIDQSLCLGCNICVAGNDLNYPGCPTNAIDK